MNVRGVEHVEGSVQKEGVSARVVRTLRREPVDRVPIDLGRHMSTGISAFAYADLRRHLGPPTGRIWISDLVQFLAAVDEDVRTRFHVDCILLEPPREATTSWSPRQGYVFAVPSHFVPEQDAEWDWIVAQGARRMRMPAGGYFFDGEWLSDWGRGSEAQRVLPAASPAEVARHVAEHVGTFKRGGGFVFTQVHNILGNVPPRNVVAMFDAAYEAGWY